MLQDTKLIIIFNFNRQQLDSYANDKYDPHFILFPNVSYAYPLPEWLVRSRRTEKAQKEAASHRTEKAPKEAAARGTSPPPAASADGGSGVLRRRLRPLRTAARRRRRLLPTTVRGVARFFRINPADVFFAEIILLTLMSKGGAWRR
jgi:hypothetical protein